MSQKDEKDEPSPLDAFADAMMKTLVSAAAEGAAATLDKLRDKLAGPRPRGVCNCTPGHTTAISEKGVVESIEVHARSCPAK